MFIITLGGNGFIGKHLTTKLKNYGHDVLDIDTRDINCWSDFKKCDIVIHLASSLQPNSTFDEFKNFSISPDVELLEHMVKAECKKLIFISSGGVLYKDDKISNTEKTDTVVNSYYAFSKIQTENLIKLYSKLHDVQYIILRPSTVYGSTKLKSGKGFIDNTVYNIHNGLDVNVWGNGEAVRDYLYIDDLVESITALLSSNFNNTVYNIGTGIGTSINEILAIMKNVTGKEFNVKYSDDILNMRCNVLNSDKICEHIGWKYSTSVINGIRKLWENYETK